MLKNSPTIITPSRQIFALDLGTTKFCLATLRQNDGQKPEIEHVVVPSGGMRRGMVCDMNEARGALDTLIAQAESQFQSDIKHIYLGVAGSHLNGRIAQATLDLGGDTIRSEDQEAIQNKCQKPKDSSYEILHNIPLTYQVDQRDLVNCAVGFSGDFLKGESFIIEADKNYLKDLVRLCNTCGLTVLKLYAEPYASAMVSVPYERRQQGVVVADIGGGTTDGIVFKEGKPVKLFTVNVGGEIMTQDLATCLQIASADAHRLKHHFGLYHATHNRAQGYRPDEREKPSKRMAVEQITGRKVHISGHHVYKILSCRIVELYHLIMEELGPLADLLNSGMVITGGGSELGNIAPFISRQHSIYVNQIQPYLPKLANNTDTPHERITASTPYATVVGLLYLAWLHEEKHHRTAISAKATFHLRSFISWLKEIA